jgi:hypothetical protein
MLQFLPYGRSIGSWICLTYKTYTCHTLQCCVCQLYFRTSNYVQQRKTYKRKAATVHLNCSTVPCNTLCARIAAAVPCNTLCVRIAAAVWHKTRDVICDLQSARPWDAVPWCKTYPCQNVWSAEQCKRVVTTM